MKKLATIAAAILIVLSATPAQAQPQRGPQIRCHRNWTTCWRGREKPPALYRQPAAERRLPWCSQPRNFRKPACKYIRAYSPHHVPR